MTYTKIKSTFVKNELKKTSWKKRDYIGDLMRIEGLALGYCYGLATGYMLVGFPNKYPKQWKAIWMELNLKGYKSNLNYKKKEAERERKEDERFKQEEKLELKRDKEDWGKMSGG
jgi:hypothetical protein